MGPPREVEKVRFRYEEVLNNVPIAPIVPVLQDGLTKLLQADPEELSKSRPDRPRPGAGVLVPRAMQRFRISPWKRDWPTISSSIRMREVKVDLLRLLHRFLGHR